MAKILLIISALVIAATAYLGFATKQKVDGIQEDLKKNKQTLSVTQSDLSKTKTTLKKSEEDLIAAKDTINERDKEIAQKKGELDKATADLTARTQELDALKKEIEELKIVPGGGSIPEMVAKLKELNERATKLEADLKQKTAEAEEQKALYEASQAEKKAAEDQLVSSQREVKAYKDKAVALGLTGTIRAYNPGWNFVVLSIGDRHGLKAGVQMVVKRGGQMVGKVKVTSVEPGSSIADIVPGSVPKGMSVEPGDSVVYEGPRGNY